MGAQLGKDPAAKLLSRPTADTASSSGNATQIARRKSERIQSLKNAQMSDKDREDEIEASKVHWSQTEVVASEDASKLIEDNVKVFRSLKKRWPSECGPKFRWKWSSGQSNVQLVDRFASKSFWNWHHEGLVVQEKPFAKGGQADIFDALAVNYDVELVLKVFKDGWHLQDLQKQWPEGMLGDESTQRSGYFSRGKFCNKILGLTVMKNGRYAFVMEKCTTDLRKLIDCRMKQNGGQDPRFPNDIAFKCMWQIAKGMQNLHEIDLIHRDLKAANVLIQQASRYRDFDPTQDKKFTCKIADFESSVGVEGTGFWRAPEVLQSLKKRSKERGKDRLKDGVGKTLELFTKQSDVYSYAMTCFEILTGEMPLQGIEMNNYDSVICGARPKLPSDISSWLEDLLYRCWDADPSKRPSFEEIVKILETNANCELE